MRVKVKATGETLEVYPGSVDGKFAMHTKDGRQFTWGEIDSAGTHCPIAESVSASVSAIPVKVNVGVSGGLKVTSKAEMLAAAIESAPDTKWQALGQVISAEVRERSRGRPTCQHTWGRWSRNDPYPSERTCAKCGETEQSL